MTRLFATLCGFVFLVNFGRVAFAPLNDPLQSAFGVGGAEIGFVISLVWLGSALSRFPVGYLLTKVPRHRIVLGAGVFLASASALTATATSLAQLQVGALAIGLASGAYFVAAVPLVAELYPAARGRAIGVHGTASQLAAVFAPGIIVGILSVLYWEYVFWLLAGATLAVTAVVLVVTDRTPIPVGAGADADFLTALSHWRLMLVGICFVGVPGFVWQGLFNFYEPYMIGAKGLSTGSASLMLTVIFAAGVPAFWFGGRFVDRFPHVPTVLGIQLLFASGVVALSFTRSFLGLLVVTAMLGFVIHALFPVIDTYMLESLPAETRASVYAVFSGLSLSFESTGSSVLGYLTDAGLPILAEGGLPFDVVFAGAGVGLGVVFVVLLALYLAGRLPEPTRGSPATVGDAP
ncbi:MFS transporter [Haloferacaceae archaeon DSL9]